MSAESSLEQAVVRYCKAWGVLTYKFVSPSNRGVPDRVFIAQNGRVGFLELKAPGKKPTEMQSRIIAEFQARGVACDWADNMARCAAFIQGLANTLGVAAGPTTETKRKERIEDDLVQALKSYLALKSKLAAAPGSKGGKVIHTHGNEDQ